MERPRAHQLETESIHYVESTLPSRWITRRQDPDYGEDLTVQIVAGDNTVTGDFLAVQVKSTGGPLERDDGFFKFRMQTQSLEYLMSLRHPAILIVYDASEKKGYWLYVQRYVYEELSGDKADWKSQITNTVKIPVTQLLSNAEDELARIARDGPAYLVRKAMEAPDEWKRAFELSGKSSDIGDILEDLDREKKAQYLKILYVSDLDLKRGTSKEVQSELIRVVGETRNSDHRAFAESAFRLSAYYNPWEKDGNLRICQLASEGLEASRAIGDKILESSFLAVMGETHYVSLVAHASNIMLAKKFNESQEFHWENSILNKVLLDTNARMISVGKLFFQALNLASEIRDINLLAKVHLRFLSTQIALYSMLLPFASRDGLAATSETIRQLINQVHGMESRGLTPAILAEAYHKEGMFLYLAGESNLALKAFSTAEGHARLADLEGMISRLQAQKEMMKAKPDPMMHSIGDVMTPEYEAETVSRLLDAWGVN